ncbi:MAG: hydroxyethylthiazole kinase, partial [Bacteroidales bacterium]
MVHAILQETRNKKPLVHAITNYVTVNDCANIILACGGSPIMADNQSEAQDIINIASSLYINMGTPNEQSIPAMISAGKYANHKGIPVILDPVGAGASAFRNNIVKDLLKEVRFSIIRGNASELKFLAGLDSQTRGVDAHTCDVVKNVHVEETRNFLQSLSAKTGAVIALSGVVDFIANPQSVYTVRNGHAMMTNMTGSGCMLGAALASFAGSFASNTP